MSERTDRKVIYLRTTERRTFTACRQKWWWSFIEGLRTKEVSNAFRFGGLVHEALGTGAPELGYTPWYKPGVKRGTHPAKTFAALYDAQIEAGLSEFTVRQDDEDSNDARTLGITMLDEYVARYGNDEHMRIVAPEFAAQVNVTDVHGKPMLVPDIDGTKKPLVYVMEFDAVYEDLNNGRLGLLETKTAAAIGTRHLGMDEQAGSYYTFAPVVLAAILKKLGKSDIDFILYNFLRKAMPDLRPQNEKGQRLNKPTKEALISFLVSKGRADVRQSMKVDELRAMVLSEHQNPDLLGEPSKTQPPENFVRHPVYRSNVARDNTLQRVRMQAWEMGQVRIGKLPVYKNPAGTWPDQHCAGCEFRDICELHEEGSDWEELRDLTMTVWDPYEAHHDEKEE